MKTSSMLLGRYIPRVSLLHARDARAKLVSTFLFSIALFATSGFDALTVATTFVVLGWHLSRVSWRTLLQTLKMLGLFLAMFFILQVIVVRTGEELATIFSFPIHKEGVFGGARIVWRTLLLFMIATLLTVTTPPLQLTAAFECLCQPLKKIRVPVSELAVMMSVALRFLPTLVGELEKMKRAQAARGLALGRQSLKKRVQMMTALLIPLIVRSLGRAEDLAQAMEARGYVPGQARTMWRKMIWTKQDSVLLLLSLLIVLLMVWL